MQSRSISDSIYERLHLIISQVLKATPHIVENYSRVGGDEFDKMSAKQVVDAYSINGLNQHVLVKNCAAVLLRCCAAVLLAVLLCCCAAVLLCCSAVLLCCCGKREREERDKKEERERAR